MTSKSDAILSRLAHSFVHNGQSFAAVPLQERLRWNANRLLPLMGWPGMVAIGLAVMCALFYFSTLRPMQSSLERLKLSVSSMQSSAMQSKVDHSADTPSEQLAEFYKFLPPEKDSPHWLGLMAEIANENGLALNHGEYAVVRESAGPMRQLKITLPVQGTYPQIREYLEDLTLEIPGMSLENVQFEREDIVDTVLQAKIKLILYLRQGA
ncbi:MAG: hypothetical protein HY306_06260 [Nitrosomonadales bacterium]|nr:hypothetical protein [Nitrosomonadales bacterium]